ncbi:methyltransferase [Aliiroseovarius sp. KMU-50]|uniref:Methyltransferase n=1 Tax=Aliiroseovarius salicola TaxID=3009082 RepID=A0ABT4VWC8_9RHOB|nr:methyltransferase domain-containing protein [Aliiroseovarius sp. KMU-50]MDA5092550.1 methyltransferase [Aliiroseovarius sp. KMU-50]
MNAKQTGFSEDKFLGGQLVLTQPVNGYRAGVDPVFLAASIAANPGDTVLDLGCGAGAAALCLGTRVDGLHLVGVERQPEYVELAQMNAKNNGIAFDVHEGDLARMPGDVRDMSFDHVIMNPPYYLRDRGTASPDAMREGALGEDVPLATWLDQATRRLKPRGYVTMIQKAERLPEIMAGIDGRLGSILVQPLCPRIGRESALIIVRARKGGRAAFRLAAPLILHDGPQHVGDVEHYTPEVSAILRDGHPFPIG